MEGEKSVVVEGEKKKGKGSRDHRAAEGVLHHAAKEEDEENRSCVDSATYVCAAGRRVPAWK